MGFQRFYLIAGAFFCVKLVGEGYAVSFRLGAPGDAGMVPLSARETAKGEEQATQLARSPDHAHQPGSSPLGNARRKKRHKKSWKNNKKVLAGEIDL